MKALTLTGIVVDELGTPLERVRVRLSGRYRTEKNDWKKVTQSAKTDGDGRFRFAKLLAGEYEVRVSKPGQVQTYRKQLVGHEKDVRLVLKAE